MAARAAQAAALAPAAAAKAQGTACFAQGDFAGALRGYNAALEALHGARDAHGELSCAGEAELAACHANAAACLLKLGRNDEAHTAAMAGLAVPAGAANVALSSKLWARAASALTALGETTTPRAKQAAAMPARLGLPPIGRPTAAEAAALAAAQRAVQGAIVLMLNDASQLRTQEALRKQLLSLFAPKDATSGVHVSARDSHGMPALYGFSAGLFDGPNADPRVPTTWLLRELLALGADPNSRFDGGRSPLMFVAHAGDVPGALEAAKLLLEAGARVNMRDEGDWTPLQSALATDDRQPGWRCAKMVRLLLAAGADACARCVRVETGTLGQTPLLLLSAHGLDSDDRLEAMDALLAAMAGNGAALAAREPFGFTAAGLVLRHSCAKKAHGKKGYAAIVSAMRAAGMDAAVDADAMSVEWTRLSNVAIAANNVVAARGLAYDVAGAQREQRVLGALLADAGLPPTRHGACEADANPYLTLYKHVMSRLPPACSQLYPSPPDDDSPEAGAMRITTRASHKELSASEMANAPFLKSFSGSPRVYAWKGLSKFREFIADACRHGFAFPVPTDEALAELAALSPLLELGAGAGYWASLLRRRGADILATDSNPPDAESLSNLYHVSEAPGARVQKADGAVAAAAYPDRALVLMYPYSHEAASKLGAAAAEWDVRAIEAYEGDVIAHVGALRWQRPAAEREAAQLSAHTHSDDAEAGDTTSRRAQEALRRRFACVKTVPLPRWPLDEDALTIWVRKDKATIAATVLASRPGVCAAGCNCALCAAARAAGEMCGRPECGARTRATGASLKRCAACVVAAYCSTECQKADWTRHKPDCKAATSATPGREE